MSFFMSLPVPLRVALVVIAILLAWLVAQQVPTLLLIAASVAWAVVIGAVLYSSGLAPGVASLPVAGRLIAAISMPAPRSAVAPAPAVNRQELAERSQQQLRALLGKHPASEVILNELVPLARNFAQEGKRVFGLSRPWVAIVHGPRGVGKSSVARALADLLIGLDVVARPVIVPVEPPLPGRMEPDWAQVLERGIDGVLMIDNAEWLAESNRITQTANSETLLATLSNLSNRYAGKFVLIVSLTTDQKDAAFGSKAAAYLKRMSVKELECNPLDEDALVQIFRNCLAEHLISCDQVGDEDLRRFVRRTKNHEAEQFDFAEAMRRGAEQVVERLKRDGRNALRPDDIKALTSDLA